MRYFQEKIPYDHYVLAPYLQAGKNVIGILVQYYGAGTMQYRDGNPGLWTDGFVKVSGQTISLASNESFLTAPCRAFDSRSPRIAVQQAFTEHFDARNWEEFSSPDYLPDACWTQAVLAERVTGEQYLRDIPKLTQELFWPKRVSRLRRVAPPSCSYVVDTRSMLLF